MNGGERLTPVAIFLKPAPSMTDPLAQRGHIGIKFEGIGESVEFDAGNNPREGAANSIKAARSFCDDMHSRIWLAIKKAVTGNDQFERMPDTPTQALADELTGVRAERDEFEKRAIDAEARLDELRKLIVPVQLEGKVS